MSDNPLDAEPAPSLGRIVHYVLNENDAASTNKRRQDAKGSGIAATESGAVVHFGNAVSAGQEFAAVVARVFPGSAGGTANLHVLLDGNDSFWATSRKIGAADEQGSWHWPERV
jgi:hypothetical protein